MATKDQPAAENRWLACKKAAARAFGLRAMRHLDPGLNEALKKANLLGQDGTVLSAPIAKALAKAGLSLFAEDTLYGSVNTVANNPWTKGRENLTEQGQIANSNPERARTLAKAAGINPKF